MVEPRPLSGKLKRRIFFASPFALIGSIFFLFGSIFVVVFGSSTDFQSAFRMSDTDPLVPGILIGTERTGSSVNKQRIYDHHYRYHVGTNVYEGHAFAQNKGLTPDSPVIVQYAAGNPSVSRIQGMRKAPFGLHVMFFVAIFPTVGLVFLIGAVRQYKKHAHLVRHGVLSTGKVVRKVPTSTRINQKTVYEVFFRFKSHDGVEHEACVSSHQHENLGDEAREPLVYDADKPSQAVLLDSLPAPIRQLLSAG